MSLFKKSTVKEQLLDQYSTLLPDKDSIITVKKQITSVESTRDKIVSRWQELEEEYAAATSEDNSIQTENVGFEGFTKSVADYFKKRKQLRDPADLITETKATAQFQHDFMTAKLAELKPVISELSSQQLAKVRDIEESYETSKNTDEVDTVVNDLSQDVNSLIERYNDLCSKKDLSLSKGDKTVVISSNTLQLIKRESLAEKQSMAATNAQDNLMHHLRAQKAVDDQAKAEGRPVAAVGWYDRV